MAITEYHKKNKSGIEITQIVFMHDDNGKMKEMVIRNDGKPFGRLLIETDSAGNYIGGVRYDSVDNVKYFYTDLSQDIYGNVLEGKEHNADSSLYTSWKNNYNNQCFTGEEVIDSTGKVEYRSSVKVDDKGNRSVFNSTEITKDSTTNKSITYNTRHTIKRVTGRKGR